MTDEDLARYEALKAKYDRLKGANEPVDAAAHEVNAWVKEMVAANKIPAADAWRMGVGGGFEPDSASS